MSGDIFLGLLLNVGLLVLVATMLTKIPVVRHMLLDGNSSIGSRTALAIIFGLVSIFSTYTGIKTNGAIVNTRVIGVVASGLIGGPYVGIGTALIAGLHRYLFDIGGFTALSCAISTLVEGMIGALFYKYFRKGNYGSIGVFLITMLAEICQMLIILAISRPFTDAVLLVKQIALPMIFLNSIGMVIFIGTFNVVFNEESYEFANKMRLALRIVDRCLPHLRKGLYSRQDMDETANIIFDSLTCSGVMITDLEKVLALKTDAKGGEILKNNKLLQPVLDTLPHNKAALLHFHPKDAPFHSLMKNYTMIAAPLAELENPIGCIVILVKKQWHTSNVSVEFVGDLARLFSTQLDLAVLENQKKLRRKAEFRALQSQVNPHFLYNALNTISYVCRENPDRARELLLTLSTYYRQNLENHRYMLSIHTELFQINNYLELEKARFEEKLQIEIHIADDMDCMVPAFILQPLVENAIRHGADLTGNRFVCIAALKRDSQIEISVSDHGTGFSPAIISNLYSGQQNGNSYGLENVHKRLKSIYGEKNGIQIDSSSSGSKIFFTIPLENENEKHIETRKEMS